MTHRFLYILVWSDQRCAMPNAEPSCDILAAQTVSTQTNIAFEEIEYIGSKLFWFIFWENRPWCAPPNAEPSCDMLAAQTAHYWLIRRPRVHITFRTVFSWVNLGLKVFCVGEPLDDFGLEHIIFQGFKDY